MFVLEAEGGEKPSCPHIFCAGGPDLEGRGWAWHDDLRCQLCYSGTEVAAPAPLVSNAINGRELPGIDRLLAVAVLREQYGLGVINRLFLKVCPVCDRDHRERADRSIRVVKQIHPDAVPFLRAARVAEGCIREPRYIKKGDKIRNEDLEKKMKEMSKEELKKFLRNQRRREQSLPVHVGDPEKTRAAQIAFAIRYATANGILLPQTLRQVACSSATS